MEDDCDGRRRMKEGKERVEIGMGGWGMGWAAARPWPGFMSGLVRLAQQVDDVMIKHVTRVPACRYQR